MVRVPFNEVINYWLPSYVCVCNTNSFAKSKVIEHAHVGFFAPFGLKVNKNQRTRVFKMSKEYHQFSKIQEKLELVSVPMD